MNIRPIFDRMLLREDDENPLGYTARDRACIGVVGLSAGAGVSTLIFSMARYIANLKTRTPTVLELSDGDEGICGWNYDVIGADRRFADREYLSCYRRMEECRGVAGVANMDEGINWMLRLPSERALALDPQQMTSLIGNAEGDVILCDFSARLGSGLADEDARLDCLKKLLRDMTLIVPVVDPAPSKLLGGHKRLSMLKELEAASHSVLYVINKFGKGVNKRELYDYLKPRRKTVIGLIDPDELCEAEYNCKNPYAMPAVKRAATAAIETVLAAAGVIRNPEPQA
ncbi:MAG: hypothetical protein LBP30_08270 [Clostridiales Family XIII bacterium]|jgi:hypothetical protein|nr:hypothetical protein [Clostridiales Family XIII bacterium]